MAVTTRNSAWAPLPSPEAPSPYHRIVPALLGIGLLAACLYALTEGDANARFLQVGATIGVLVYLATLIDILLGLVFLVVLIGLSPEVSLAGLNQLRLEDFVVPSLALAWLIRAARSEDKPPPLLLGGPALAVFASMALSSLLGIVAGGTTAARALPVLAKYVEYYLIFAIVARNVTTEREFRPLVILTAATGVAGVLLGFLGMEGRRVSGPMGETATIFGGYLGQTFSIALGLFLHAGGPGARIASGLGAAVLLGGIIKTYSRTTYVSLMTSLGLFGVFKERRLLPLLLLGGAFGFLLLPDDVRERMATLAGIATGGTPSWDARTASWESVLLGLSGTDFLWGRGAGSVVLGDVDNEYIRVIADVGVLGLGVFAWFLVKAFRIAAAHYETLPAGGFHKGFAAGYLMAFVMLCVHGIGATSFTAIRTMEMFMVLTGLMVCQAGRAAEWGLIPDPEKRPESTPTPAPAPYPIDLR